MKETGLTFGVWDSKDKWSNLNIILSFKFYNDVFFKSIAERHFTYAAFIPFIIGLFIKRNNLRERLFDIWLLSIVLYILLLAKGNQVHEYYQLPFMLPAVVFAGKAFAKYFPIRISDFSLSNFSSEENKNWLSYVFVLFFVLTLLLSFLRISNFYKNEDLNSPLFKMSDEIKKASAPNDLIITVCNGDPLFLYRADRKGWAVNPDKMNSENIKDKKDKGAKIISGEKSVLENDEEKKNFEELKKHYQVITDNDDYFILKLN